MPGATARNEMPARVRISIRRGEVDASRIVNG
jgi:hypothetical protein